MSRGRCRGVGVAGSGGGGSGRQSSCGRASSAKKGKTRRTSGHGTRDECALKRHDHALAAPAGHHEGGLIGRRRQRHGGHVGVAPLGLHGPEPGPCGVLLLVRWCVADRRRWHHREQPERLAAGGGSEVRGEGGARGFGDDRRRARSQSPSRPRRWSFAETAFCPLPVSHFQAPVGKAEGKPRALLIDDDRRHVRGRCQRRLPNPGPHLQAWSPRVSAGQPD